MNNMQNKKIGKWRRFKLDHFLNGKIYNLVIIHKSYKDSTMREVQLVKYGEELSVTDKKDRELYKNIESLKDYFYKMF